MYEVLCALVKDGQNWVAIKDKVTGHHGCGVLGKDGDVWVWCGDMAMEIVSPIEFDERFVVFGMDLSEEEFQEVLEVLQ